MQKPDINWGSAELSDKDQFTLLMLAPLAAGAILPVLTGTIDGLGPWLVEHHVIAADGVLVPLPGADGAGLDLARTAIGALVLVVLTCLAVIARQHRAQDQ
ncbi:hypothetical protein [Jiangella rhizosphaerae]|uniref:Uncharacterized protein n=1 Tax=Jiangella rhizosphaerae TaxID=2293569 RepID=A0A418KH61_9ACTN|nr:hypothetical protein [Jiangella rhizosphaerae]RIQ11421.1 hypothetical protein DY240_28745 [Jiangella rhizosphaerae]